MNVGDKGDAVSVFDISHPKFERECCISNNVRTSAGLYIKNGHKLKQDFHTLYKFSPDSKKNRERQKFRKKADGKYSKEKRKKVELTSISSCTIPSAQPAIELLGNPSSFAVYAQVRSLVLENVTRQAQNIYLSTTQHQPADSDSDSDNDRSKDSVVEIPKIVGLGLVSVYELIRGSITAYPSLCIRALEALLDILQGQQPEALSRESPDVIDTLFNLLLRLATASNGDVLTCPSSPLVGVACACLLSLVVARGETGKFLRATADILMTSRQLASQNIQIPVILTLLQRSVHAVLLGKTSRPDWLHYGVPQASLVEKFVVKMPSEGDEDKCSMACDGHYLYIHSRRGLFKIGSGYGGTNKGHVYLHRPDFYPCQTGWLGFAHDDLLFRPGEGESELMVVDRDVLKVTEVSQCPQRGWERGLAFSDGACIGNIVPDKEDGFVIRTYNPQVKPMPMISEISISLAEKCIQVLGGSDGQTCLAPGLDEDLVFITAGKDFMLGRTPSGKVYFCGKGSSVGMKHAVGPGTVPHNTNSERVINGPSVSHSATYTLAGTSSGKWPELVITKSPRIIHVAVGHEGQHGLIVSDEGTAFFVGTARRGEDGDGNKVRRQPKAVKPKKMLKMDGHFIVSAACNNGTSALVTRDGELYMFGKDTFNCDQSCGLVTDLKDVHVSRVSLGKAHVLALTSKGQVFTFGINNKGQCGRDFAPHAKEGAAEGPSVSMGEEDGDDDEGNESSEEVVEGAMCHPGRHRWARDNCMVCTVCHECTGYGPACVSSGRPNRSPAMPCGCGSGDSGCSECGCCRTCADEGEMEGGDGLPLMHMQPLGLLPEVANLEGKFFGHAMERVRDELLLRVDQRRSQARGRQGRFTSSTSRKPMDEGVGSDQEKDTSKIVAISPAKVQMPTTSHVIEIGCGLHHSIVLCANGEVYTWGSNSYGQLGTGDLTSHGAPTLIRMPPLLKVTSVAAGSNHCVLLTSNGQIYTFGSYQKGQLGRGPPQYDAGEGSSRGRAPWYAVPAPVPGIGPRMGKRATWIGASADATFVKLDQSLINAYNLQSSNVIANSSCLMLLPVSRKPRREEESWRCLVISRSEGTCKSFSSETQVDFSGQTVCLDPVFNVIWSYNGGTHQVKCFNIIAAEAQRIPESNPPEGLRDILSSALSLPVLPDFQVSRAQVALHMLSCMDTVTWAHENGLSVAEDDSQSVSVSRVYTKEDFIAVNRFESHGGGWGYSGHSIEAIRFMCDTDVLLGGFGLFGGRGEYLGKIKLFELGPEGGEQEVDGEILAETEEIPYECGARQKFPMLFDEPIPIQGNKWYVAWARVSGPSSDCGSSGQSMITTDDQLIFYFKSSKKSNNGTDVNAGQIPQILYRITSSETNSQTKASHAEEPVPILSKNFYINVTNDAFQALLDLLNWSWGTLCSCIEEQVNQRANNSGRQIIAKLDLQRLVYICCSCLRLLRIYINEIYPNSVKSNRVAGEKECLAESVAHVRSLLRQMLSDPLPTPSFVNPNIGRRGKHRPSKSDPNSYGRMIAAVLEESHTTFVACFHAFYPTGQLKWSCLCDLLLSRDEGCEESHASDRLLSAVLASLCSPTVKLRATCPILTDHETEGAQRPSPADNAALSTLQPGDLYRYPILVEHMTYKIQAGNGVGMMWTFREVLDRLLGVICGGVRQALREEKVVPLPSLVHNTCLLLSAAVAELAAETTTFESEAPASGRVLHVTPCRFTRISQSRTWSTGNGSPDAICFSVDRPGILVAGACVYGGVGTYDYELELMDETGAGPLEGSSSHALERLSVVEVVRGSFGPEDAVMDVVEIKFERPYPIKEGTKYAIRLTNRGGRTSNGDGGMPSVKGPDGTTFTFSGCSLSVNGTNQIRGQIPQILYFSTPQDPDNQLTTKEIAEHQARRSALTMVGSVLRAATELMIMGLGIGDDTAVEVLSSAPVVTLLLPLLLAHIRPVAVSDPRSAVAVIGMIQEVLPHVAALNNLSLATQKAALPETLEECHTTTSHHYAWIESDHPYKPSSVSNQKVSFPSCVQWMTLEFDAQCATAQPEDTLQIYIPCSSTSKADSGLKNELADGKEQATVTSEHKLSPYWAVMNKFSGSKNWPQQTIVLPGNELVFSLETASDYVKEEKSSSYGFRVLVIGYEWPPSPPDALRHLEKELAHLGGLCAASLIKKSLVLPPIPGEDTEEDMQMVEEISRQVYAAHPTLLSKGFALSHPPTIHQTLDGVIPFSCHSNERLFLRDFVSCSGGTSGGRLARWLQPDSYVDIRACEVLYSRDDMRAGWPAIITIITRDQYNEVVHAPSVKVEVIAVPISTGDEGTKGKLRRFSQHIADNMTFGGHPQPSLDTPYQVSIKDKMCYCAISMMKAYESYSFEELRYVSPAVRRPTENMLVRSNNDGSYSCNWTPGSTGWYSLNIKVDSYQLEKTYKLEVKDPPQGMIPPVQNPVKRPAQQPSRLRKFTLPNSSGLRIRTHPSLQSEQLGVVQVNGTIAFVDEVHNSDGVWLRLSLESIRQYCSESHSEAWCLQYNQHLGKTLLVPLDQPKTILDQVITDTISRRGGGQPFSMGRNQPGGRIEAAPASLYTVIKCGASGHNIRSKPNLKAPAVGMLVLGNTFTVDSEVMNKEGTWVKLDSESTRKYCFTDGDAWSLSVSKGHTLYLQCSQPPKEHSALQDGFTADNHQSGFDFTQSQTNPVFKSFQPSGSGTKSPFVFGSSTGPQDLYGDKEPYLDSGKLKISGSQEEELDRDVSPQGGKFSLVNRWLKEGQHKEAPPKKSPPIDRKKSQPVAVSANPKDIPPELQGVSVKELVKAIGESRANGNGATPPRTPPATPKRVSRSSSPRAALGTSRHSSRGSSPVPIPGRDRESLGSSSLHSSPRGGIGSFVSIEESDRSPLGEGPGVAPDSRSVNESASDTSVMVSSLPQDVSPSQSATSAFSTPRKVKSAEAAPAASGKTTTQSSTQTSPEGVKFSIGTSKEEVPLKVSPKNARKERGGPKPLRTKRERPASPGSLPNARERPKEAMSPSVAECLRAVFAAFLWHEGIAHDAMACASFLKFHPDLTKQGTFLWKLCQNKGPSKGEVKLTKEQKARQRHSVEVSAYSYLNVVVQNTDELHKLSPNANIIEDPKESLSEVRSPQPDGTPNYLQGTSQGCKLATVMEGSSPGGASAKDSLELPLVLRHVVLLWEELTSSCLKAITQQIILPSPSVPNRMKKAEKVEKKQEKEKKRTKKKPLVPVKQLSNDAAEDELGGQCELCGQAVSQHESEEHFKVSHPGCGGASHGCGYMGTRWKFYPSKDRLPLPCGKMFRGCYHMCWNCRNKFKGQSPQLNLLREASGRKSKRKSGIKMPSPMPTIDTHVVMRNNAMFLLDLASAASTNILTRSHAPRKSPCPMPCVSELSPDTSPFPKVAFQCLHTLNCQQQHLNQLREDLLLHQHHQLHSSDTTTTTTGTNGYYSSSGDSKENQREGTNYSPGHSHQESPASDPEVSWRPFHRSISVTVGPSGQDWSSSPAVAAAAAAAQNDNVAQRSGVVMRKRNNSSSETQGSGVSSLLAHPSIALEKLAGPMARVGGVSDPGGRSRQVVVRPVMTFIFQSHDLETLAFAMRHATRKAAARVYAMQALNWLLQSVTQPTCLHDLLWCFVAALTPLCSPSAAGEAQLNAEKQEKYHDVDGEIVVLEHPLSDVTLSGDAIHPLPLTFHQLLQTIADLMMLLPPGSPLQMMAVRCWGLRFSPADHDFLHQSHVFSNISKILSRSEEVLGGGEEGGASSLCDPHTSVTSQVTSLYDLTAECEVKASSRQAMVSSLTDSSTETFWESGDEDRNRTKVLTVNCPSRVTPRVVYIHIDNCRDLGNKVSMVILKAGPAADEVFLVQQVDVETRFTGWVHAYLPPKEDDKQIPTCILTELRGPDQSVRVRQIRVLGTDPSVEKNAPKVARGYSPLALQNRMCEQETLKVFRLITGQVFGRLLSNGVRKEPPEGEEDAPISPSEALEDGDHNNDLREHMVGILFSRSKLTHLQKQVCSHIVQAIKKEAKRARDEWEAGLLTGASLQATPATPEEGQHTPPDTYCFEMLSMVLALSGSPVGRAHLAHQENLLKHLLSLLHTGSARVQRQVVSLFRRMLVDITPPTLAQVLGVKDLPPLDLTVLQMPSQETEEPFDMHRQGVLDVFLAVIAKALVVQIKNKSNENIKASSPECSSGKAGVASVTLSDAMVKPQSNSSRWWLQGVATRKLADLIISLIRDMTNSQLTENWGHVSKGAIAENIINLTRLKEQDRNTVSSCLSTPTLWLALASLCVLHPDHIEALSSRQWRTSTNADASQPHLRPMCENHDDGSTAAMILCDSCGNLCGECDRILHLHRRTRSHHRTVFREEQQAIKVDLHEGCGRTKLFWLLALADSTTLKAMLELRSENSRSREGGSGVSSCRFCGSPAQTSLLSPVPVCQDPDCQEYSRDACTRLLDCNHVCGGIKGEGNCLPCLMGCSPDNTLKQDADDMCMICFSEALAAAPCLQLECGHVFHLHCCRSVLSKRWPGPRITFTFSLCPICKVPMKHWSLSELLQPILSLYEDVRRKALMRLEYEGLLKAEAVASPGARYHNDPASFAMDRYAYYVCFKCSKAYYGGEARCENDVGPNDDYDPRELVCGACSDVSRAQMCPKHGTDFLEYKCRYCCSVAVFFCFGTTHFCNACHEDFQRVTNIPKGDLPHCPAGSRAQQLAGEECPLHVQHPPTGEEFALGCGVCRNAHTF